jgi:hypothetical protein
MARRIMNRKELRANYEAAERRKTGEGEEPEEEDAEEEEEEDEASDEEGEGEGDEEAGEDGEEGDEEAPKKRKPAKPAKPKAKPRTRTVKIVRMRVVWGVFNNSNQRVATYDYPKRSDADAHAAKLTADKKLTHFVQPVKEPIEEKKE